jgi:MFS family permease
MQKSGILTNLSVKNTFTSLKYPNYRLWFGGQLVSLVGTWMQSAAQGFLVYQLTGSPAYLGYVGFAAGLPTWIFTLYAGVVADRIPRRTMMVVSQAVMMLLAFILAFLTFSGLVQPWHIIVLAFCLGIANAFDAPARQSFILEMVDRPDLSNAIALNATMFTSAIVIGPAVGGLAYAAFGPAWCFAINAVSYLAVILALLLMKLKPWTPPERKSQAWEDLKAGLKYVASNKIVLMLILNLGVFSLFGVGTMALLPAWSVEILGGDAATNGWMLSARGLGSLVGALLIASLGSAVFRGRLLTLGTFMLPIILLVFTFVHWLPLALILLVGIGFAFIAINNSSNALVQLQVRDELRGRVMGVYIMIFFGAMPLGSLYAGSTAAWLGEPATILLSALILICFAGFVYWRFPKMRQLG